MVLDEHRRVYVGATSESAGIAKRIRQHWTHQKQFDRLVAGSVETSVLSIDSFRALDTTRIFAMTTSECFDEEDLLLQQFPPKFALNRGMGGRGVERFASLRDVGDIDSRLLETSACPERRSTDGLEPSPSDPFTVET
jgi:hypothetical protein